MGKKRCVYSLCTNSVSSKDCDKSVRYFPFPRPKKDIDKCKRWVSACGRYDNLLEISKLNRYTHYLCSDHFPSSHGPTVEHPDPLPFKESAGSVLVSFILIMNVSVSFYN